MAQPLHARGSDYLPVVAGAAASGVAIGYVRLMRQQRDVPSAWFLGGLILAAVLAFYGAVRVAPRRGRALLASGAMLIPLGAIAILSIGFPILGAGVIALIAAKRSERVGPSGG